MKTNIGKPRKIKSPESLVKLFEDYLDTCFNIEKDENGKEIIENIKPLSLLSFSNFIGINRDTLWDYSKLPEYSDTIKKIKEYIEAWIADQLYVNPRTAGLIFILKNGYDWKDKIETENINTNLNTTLNIEFVDENKVDE